MKKGSTITQKYLINLVLIVIIGSLILISLKGIFNGKKYFTEYYSKELGLISDLIINNPYDIEVMYDKIKPGYDVELTKKDIIVKTKNKKSDKEYLFFRRKINNINNLLIKNNLIKDAFIIILSKEKNEFTLNEFFNLNLCNNNFEKIAVYSEDNEVNNILKKLGVKINKKGYEVIFIQEKNKNKEDNNITIISKNINNSFFCNLNYFLRKEGFKTELKNNNNYDKKIVIKYNDRIEKKFLIEKIGLFMVVYNEKR